MKKPNESFTDIINRLTGRRSMVELAGEMKRIVKGIRKKSSKRVQALSQRMSGS